jgi:hypothetical protein
MLIDAVTEKLRNVYHKELTAGELLKSLKTVRIGLVNPSADADELIYKQIDAIKSTVDVGKKSGSLSKDMHNAYLGTIATMEKILPVLKESNPQNGTEAFAVIKKEFDNYTKILKADATNAGEKLSNVFKFCEEVFPDGQELLILVTELTISYYGAHFISRYGCKEYFNHNKELLFYERQKELIAEIEDLDLEE